MAIGDVTVQDGNITLVDDSWIGLGPAAGRLIFDDQETDRLNLLNCRFGIGTTITDRALVIKLEDSAGSDGVSIINSSNEEKLAIDSWGNITAKWSGVAEAAVDIRRNSPTDLVGDLLDCYRGQCRRTSGANTRVAYFAAEVTPDSASDNQVYGLNSFAYHMGGANLTRTEDALGLCGGRYAARSRASGYTASKVCGISTYCEIEYPYTATFTDAMGIYVEQIHARQGTIVNGYGLYVENMGQGGPGELTNAYGVYLPAQTAATTLNVGLYIADAGTYSIQLASEDGDAASGITFGTDTNLYRSAANTLKTDDSLFIADGQNIIFDTTTGSKIGTATTQKIGFWNATPVIQQAHIADAGASDVSGVDTVDEDVVNSNFASLASSINSVISLLETLGLVASA